MNELESDDCLQDLRLRVSRTVCIAVSSLMFGKERRKPNPQPTRGDVVKGTPITPFSTRKEQIVGRHHVQMVFELKFQRGFQIQPEQT
jgi:hypothetical protein